jgi:hypothetical protein
MTKERMTCAHFKAGDHGFRCELGSQMPTEPGKTCPDWGIWQVNNFLFRD